MTNFLDTFAELNSAFAQGEDAVLVLPVTQVIEDPNQPRVTFDETELEELTVTVRERGVLQPIVVQPQNADGLYVIRFGARRYRATLRAGRTEIKAIIRAGSDDEADVLIEQVIENEQRAGLNTAEMAHTVARLLDLGRTQAEIGRGLGKAKDVIAMLASVRKMPTALQDLAPHLGVRTLYELHSAWKADADGVRSWLKDRDPKTITQAEARQLAAKPSTRNKDPAPAKPKTMERAAPKPAPVAKSSDPASGLIVEVTVNGRAGRLLLDQVPSAETQALVHFADAQTPEAAPLAKIRLVRLHHPMSD